MFSYCCGLFYKNNYEEQIPLFPEKYKFTITITANQSLVNYFNKHSFVKFSNHSNNTSSYYLSNEKSIMTQLELFDQLTALFNIENLTDYRYILAIISKPTKKMIFSKISCRIYIYKLQITNYKLQLHIQCQFKIMFMMISTHNVKYF